MWAVMGNGTIEPMEWVSFSRFNTLLCHHLFQLWIPSVPLRMEPSFFFWCIQLSFLSSILLLSILGEAIYFGNFTYGMPFSLNISWMVGWKLSRQNTPNQLNIIDLLHDLKVFFSAPWHCWNSGYETNTLPMSHQERCWNAVFFLAWSWLWSRSLSCIFCFFSC